MFRPIAAIFRLLQFYSKSIIYIPTLRGDAEISLEISASPRNIGIYMILFEQKGDRGSTVDKVLCYKSEGRWFDPSWCQLIFL